MVLPAGVTETWPCALIVSPLELAGIVMAGCTTLPAAVSLLTPLHGTEPRLAENLTSFLDEISLAYGRQGPAQRVARSIRTKLQNATISEIFQKKGLHEFLTEFIADNERLGVAITEQYLT